MIHTGRVNGAAIRIILPPEILRPNVTAQENTRMLFRPAQIKRTCHDGRNADSHFCESAGIRPQTAERTIATIAVQDICRILESGSEQVTRRHSQQNRRGKHEGGPTIRKPVIARQHAAVCGHGTSPSFPDPCKGCI